MRKLAAEFGISDVGLAKICRKNGIPLPGLGHWRLVETGHPPKQEPLPAIEPGQSDTITITPYERGPHDLPRKAELGPIPKVEVGTSREITHPLALRLKKVFQPTSKNEQGHMIPREIKGPNIRVSADTFPRVLRILDALFFAAERQGRSLVWDPAPEAKPRILVDGEGITLAVLEKFDRQAHTLTQDEIKRRKKNEYVWVPQWDYVPTGELRLWIDGLPWDLRHIRTAWADGKTRRVENCLGEALAILPHLAKALREVREDHERERLREEEERRQAEKRRAERAEYDRKAKITTQFLRGWKDSKALHKFAVAIEELAGKSSRDEQKKELLEMAKWIGTHADYVDPLTDLNWMTNQFFNRGGRT